MRGEPWKQGDFVPLFAQSPYSLLDHAEVHDVAFFTHRAAQIHLRIPSSCVAVGKAFPEQAGGTGCSPNPHTHGHLVVMTMQALPRAVPKHHEVGCIELEVRLSDG